MDTIFVALCRTFESLSPMNTNEVAVWIKNILRVGAPTKRSKKILGKTAVYQYATDVILRDAKQYRMAVQLLYRELSAKGWIIDHGAKGIVWRNKKHPEVTIRFEPMVYASGGVRLSFTVTYYEKLLLVGKKDHKPFRIDVSNTLPNDDELDTLIADLINKPAPKIVFHKTKEVPLDSLF